MDRYDRTTSRNTEEQQDEPFYYPQACTKEDVIWPGSDTETAEEIQQKRSRYEHQARRYLRGHLPVLESATLRGPFSGWTNPWRWVPEMKEDDWWQPGSENMLFTRANVMKRAADHGLGYLGPSEALAWCKASAKAEAQRIRDISAESDTQAEMEKMPLVLDPEEATEQPVPKRSPSTLNSNPTKPYGRQSMVNHHSDTPHYSEFAGDNTRGTKRPIDFQWLKGSYVSKRARWDEPVISTPTPLPEIGERPRRRHHSSPKRNGSGNSRTSVPSRLSVNFAGLQSEKLQLDILASQPDLPLVAFAKGVNTSVKSARLGDWRGLTSEQNGDFLERQREAIDEVHDESQRSSTGSTSWRICRRRSDTRSRGITDASCLDIESDDLIMITRHQQPSPRTPASRLSQNGTSSSRSKQLPKLPRNSPARYNGLEARNAVGGEDYSFITEVALSSRDLEMFQYRKKGKRKASKVLKTDPSDHSLVDIQKPPGMTLKSEKNDEDEHQPYGMGLIEVETGKEMDIAHDIIESPASEDRERQGSHRPESSWDFMDGVTEQPLFPLVEDRIATESLPSRQFALAEHSPGIPTPQAGEISSRMSRQHSSQSHHQLQSLADPGKKSPRPSAAKRVVRNCQDPNEMNTQSYNTSTLRLVGSSGSENLPGYSVDENHYEATSSEEIEIVMEHIQKTLSQQCGSSLSAACTQSDYEENEVGLELIQEPSLNRRYAPQSSSPNGSFQNLVEEEAMSMDRAVDALPEHTVTNQLQATQHAQCRHDEDPFHGENPEIEVTAKPLTVAAVIAQHNSCKIINRQYTWTSTDSNDPTTDITRVEKHVTGSLRDNNGSEDAGRKVDGQSVRHEPASTKAADMESETSWEGCGPQSPWAAENLQPLPMSRPETEGQGILLNSFVSGADGLLKGDYSPNETSQSEQLDCHIRERPQTPQNDVITPFKDLMSPTPTRKMRGSHLKAGELPSTQSLIDAATNNPWNSNLRNPSAKRSRKRVSFGVLPVKKTENLLPDTPDDLDPSRRRPRSPPPPQDGNDENMFDMDTSNIHPFGSHFNAARQLKHIFPWNSSSPLNSSPAFGAQAEAFIAADCEASERRRSTPPPKPPSRQLIQTSPEAPVTGLSNIMASFDMEDALGDVSDFLEDWSVDAELKKAKELGSSSRRESNGFRRRKMFGIV